MLYQLSYRGGRPRCGCQAHMEPKRCACVASAAHNVAVLAAAHGASSLGSTSARLAQSVERKALNLVVVGSSLTVGVLARLAALCVTVCRRLLRNY